MRRAVGNRTRDRAPPVASLAVQSRNRRFELVRRSETAKIAGIASEKIIIVGDKSRTPVVCKGPTEIVQYPAGGGARCLCFSAPSVRGRSSVPTVKLRLIKFN